MVRKSAGEPLSEITSISEPQLFERIVAETLNPVVVVNARDPEMPIVFVNRAFEQVTGYKSSEVLGRNCRFLQANDRDQPALKEIRLAIQQKCTVTVKLNNYRKDGRRFTQEISMFPVANAEGEVTHFFSVHRDLSNHDAVEMALQHAHRGFQAVVENTLTLILVLEADGRVRYQSPSIERMLGPGAAALAGARLQERLHSEDATKVRQVFKLMQARKLSQIELEFRLRHSDGKFRYFAATINNCLDIPEVLGLVLNASDISARKEVETQLERQATMDSLTGLANTRLLNDRLTQAIAKARRRKDRFAVLFVDIDHFKSVVDSLGRHAGDEVLKEVARRICACVREPDSVARVAGDEFVVLVDGVSDPVILAGICEKILASLRAPFVFRGTKHLLTGSVGIATYPEGGDDRDALLRNADHANYQAKEAGGNTYHFFQQSQEREVLKELETRTELLMAVQRDEFHVVFQPIFNARSRAFVGAEALVRWQHPKRGTILPGDFIPSAEQSGLIRDIGQSALLKACAQWVEFQSAAGSALPLSVNLSARQFRDPALLERIEGVLQHTGLRPELLELEITETNFMSNIEQTRQAIDRIAALGIGIVLDDFGVGYSSLGYLKRFRVKKIKIDQSFVQDIGRNNMSEQLIDSMVALAQKLSIETVAEGVETEQQVNFLAQSGCDFLQGFLLSRPRSNYSLAQGFTH